MWEIVYADGKPNEFEDHLVRRVADLIGVSSRERIKLRHLSAAKCRDLDGTTQAIQRRVGEVD